MFFVCVSIERTSTCGPNLSFAQNTRPFLSVTEPIPPGPQNTNSVVTETDNRQKFFWNLKMKLIFFDEVSRKDFLERTSNNMRGILQPLLVARK